MSEYKTEEQLLVFGVNDTYTEGLVFGGTSASNNSLLVILPKTPWTFSFSINITPKVGGATDTTTKYWIRWEVYNDFSQSTIKSGLKGPLQGQNLDYPLFDLTQTGIDPNHKIKGRNDIYIYVYSEKPLL